VGPIFILWKIWLERNRRIFRGEHRLVQQIWQRIVGMIQETVEAKCEVELPLGKCDTELVERLGILDSSLALRRTRRRHYEKQKVDRIGKWQPPSYGILKINTDGSSRGNPGPAGIGGIGRDAMGSVVFIFSIYEGIQTINLVEGLAILAALEKAHAQGWRRIVCESDSQVLINLLIEQKVSDVNWKLARIVQQILKISSLMEFVTFVHIPREWNRAADCLAKWASEHAEGWRIEEWELVPQVLRSDLRSILDDDRVENDDG
jgi:ribonuclease HI